MSKALEAARRAIEAHPAYDCGSTGDEEMAKAAISAYLAHLAEDEELTQRLAEVIADAMNMNRAGRLEHDAALAALRTLAGKE